LSCSAGIRSSGLGSAGVFSKRSARTLAITRRRREGTLPQGSVAKEKKRVIARERVLEWYDPLPAAGRLFRPAKLRNAREDDPLTSANGAAYESQCSCRTQHEPEFLGPESASCKKGRQER
jgi:hypothetical protein